MKVKVGRIGARMKLNVVDDIVLLAESKRELQRVVDQFYSVCSSRKLRVNAGKSKAMLLERKEVEVVNFGNPYRVSVPEDERCEIMMGGGKKVSI